MGLPYRMPDLNGDGGMNDGEDDNHTSNPDLFEAYDAIRSASDRLSLPAQVANRACRLVEAFRMEEPDATSLAALSSACLFIACR